MPSPLTLAQARTTPKAAGTKIPMPPSPPGSKKKKTEDNDNQPGKRKRHKNDNDDIRQSIPWTAVFQFLGGDDVAKALMASKHQNPWKLLEGNEHQCVVSALKDRMMATETGKELLQKYYDNDPRILPKLLYCMDHGYGIRTDGVYQCQCQEPGSTDPPNYLIFSPTGDAVSFTTADPPVRVWNWFVHSYTTLPAYLKIPFEINFISSGSNLFQLIIANNPNPTTLFIGQNGELVLTRANERQYERRCEWTFVKV